MVRDLVHNLCGSLVENIGGVAGVGKNTPPTPITYLTQWKIVGNSEVHGQEIWSCGEPIAESLTLFDGTQELLDGFLPMSGAYPTINSSYPNAKYYVFDVKTGYTITTSITGNIRLRVIVNGSVEANINSETDNSYVTSTYDPVIQTTGSIVVKQDCQIGLLVLNSTQSYAGSITASYIKYHILVQPLGGSIADIALTEPLRKVNDVADTIEFPSSVEGKALVTRNFASVDMGSLTWDMVEISSSGYFRLRTKDIRTTAKGAPDNQSAPNALIAIYDVISSDEVYYKNTGFTISSNGIILGYDPDYNQSDSAAAFKTHVTGVELIYELATPTTELVDAPQIEEADSYSMVISQGGKAVSWSSFETN